MSEFRSGRPLARTRVTVESAAGSNPQVSRSTFAGSGGQFLFPDLPAGTYLLRAERRGFAVAYYGEKPAARMGNPIALEAATSFTADIRMRKLGVITGEVQDENRVGLAGFEVAAYRVGPPARFAASAYTDDRGVFRISGLEAGAYYIRSEARELDDEQGLLATYYGQALRTAVAKLVNVALDEEAAGIRIEPIPGRLSTLSGTLVGPLAADVTLLADAGPRTARVAPGGAFEFRQLAPGSYDLMAQSIDPAHAFSAFLRVELASERREVSLQLAPSPAVRLACQTRGSQLPAGVSAFLRRREPPEDNSRRLLCGETTTLSPGRWEVAASTPPSLYVSAYGNARSGENAYEFSLSASQELEITVVLSPNPAAISGWVYAGPEQPASGAPVFVYPLDPELHSRTGGIRHTRTNEAGQFHFAGLPPGRYELLSSFALEDRDQQPWPAGQGTILDVEEGAKVTVDLRLKDLP